MPERNTHLTTTEQWDIRWRGFSFFVFFVLIHKPGMMGAVRNFFSFVIPKNWLNFSTQTSHIFSETFGQARDLVGMGKKNLPVTLVAASIADEASLEDSSERAW